MINGTFDRFDESEVTELPNAADVTAVELWIDGERFSLDQGTYVTVNPRHGYPLRVKREIMSRESCRIL